MRLLLLIVISVITTLHYGQTVILSENFNSGNLTGWTFIDGDMAAPYNDSQVLQLPSSFHLVEDYDSTGVVDSVLAATSWLNDTVSANNFLITPKLNFDSSGNFVNFQAMSVDGSYPDGIQIYYCLDKTIDSLMNYPSLLDVPAVPSVSTDYKVNLDAVPLNTDIYLVFRHYADNQFILTLDNITVISDDISSIHDKTKNRVKIYPNPSNGEINIEGLEISKNATIYNSLGSIVWNGKVRNTLLNFHFQKGYYILSSGNIKRPFIIQ